MLRKTEKKGITRIFLWIFGGTLSIDLFYSGEPVKGIFSLLSLIIGIFLILYGVEEYEMGYSIFGYLVLFLWFLFRIKKLFSYLRMFEKIED